MPYFNAPIFLQNKTQIGKIEEIFGAINDGVHLSQPASILSVPEMVAQAECAVYLPDLPQTADHTSIPVGRQFGFGGSTQ